MKICQIAFIGENIEWVLRGILIYKTNKLILISTNNSKFIEKVKEIKERLLDPEFEKPPLEIEHFIIELEDPIEFSRTLKKAILHHHKKGFNIEINATAGLRIWQILGYFINLQLGDLIDLYFIINKRTGEPIIFPTGLLSKTEQLFLDIISEENLSIEDITKKYSDFKNKNVSLGLISKYLGKLKEKNLILESKSKKKKYFELTDLGKMYLIDPTFHNL